MSQVGVQYETITKLDGIDDGKMLFYTNIRFQYVLISIKRHSISS